MPQTETSKPVTSFVERGKGDERLNVDNRRGALDLASFNYVEEEYFVEGISDAFDPDGLRIDTDVAYCTRLLVRRPLESDVISGTVFLDPLHMINEMPASAGALEWMMANGHCWIGVTVHNSFFERVNGFVGGVEALKRTDQSRYGLMRIAEFDRPPRLRSYPGPSTDSFALKWNMAMAHPQGHPIVAQVGQLLKSDLNLLGRSADRIYGCGMSQTGNFWRLFLDNGWHERTRGTDGGPLFDAYVIGVSAAPSHHPADAVLVNILSEGEVVGSIVQMQAKAPADSDARRVRGIEIPGTAHLAAPPPGDHARFDHHHITHPVVPFYTAVYAALDTWIRGGTPMPHVSRIERDPDSIDGVARDEHGNALGGLRVPWLEAPIGQYLPRCACGPVHGEVIPFEEEKRRRLYPAEGSHQARWDRAVDRLVEDRLLLENDVHLLKANGSNPID